jgi:hypothetical protein
MYLEHDEVLISSVQFHYYDHEQSKIENIDPLNSSEYQRNTN